MDLGRGLGSREAHADEGDESSRKKLNVDFADPALFNYSRLALKNSEHTWGLSVFHYGPLADANWSNSAFHENMNSRESHLSAFIKSWQEQRAWGIDFAVEALPLNHPLRTGIESEFEDITPTELPLWTVLKRYR